MDTYTNVSARVIHAGDVMLVPGEPTPVPPEMVKSEGFQRLVKAQEIKQGEAEIKPEEEQAPEPEKLKETTTAKPQAVRPK